MVFSLMTGDLYLSTKRHQQVQPRWVPNWTWNCDNDSSSSLHGTYGLVFSDQLVPNLLLTDLKMHNSQPEQISAFVNLFVPWLWEVHLFLNHQPPLFCFCGPFQRRKYTITIAVAMGISENLRMEDVLFTYFHLMFMLRFESKFQMLKG